MGNREGYVFCCEGGDVCGIYVGRSQNLYVKYWKERKGESKLREERRKHNIKGRWEEGMGVGWREEEWKGEKGKGKERGMCGGHERGRRSMEKRKRGREEREGAKESLTWKRVEDLVQRKQISP